MHRTLVVLGLTAAFAATYPTPLLAQRGAPRPMPRSSEPSLRAPNERERALRQQPPVDVEDLLRQLPASERDRLRALLGQRYGYSRDFTTSVPAPQPVEAPPKQPVEAGEGRDQVRPDPGRDSSQRSVPTAGLQPAPVQEVVTIDAASTEKTPTREARVRFSSIPSSVSLHLPFHFTVELLDGDSQQGVPLHFDRSEGISYTPEQLVLTGGSRHDVEATVTTAPGGLAEIIATVGSDEPIRTTIDVQFSSNLKIDVADLEAGSESDVSVLFLDKRGIPVQLGGPVTVRLSGRGLLFDQDGKWVQDVDLTVPKGASRTSRLSIRPTSWGINAAGIDATILLGELVVADTSTRLTVASSQIARLSMYLLGSTICAAYLALRARRFAIKPLLIRLGAATIAGLIAFFAAELNLFGPSTGVVSLRSLVVIGFLFAYFGLETILSSKFQQFAKETVPKPFEPRHEKRRRRINVSE